MPQLRRSIKIVGTSLNFSIDEAFRSAVNTLPGGGGYKVEITKIHANVGGIVGNLLTVEAKAQRL